MGDRAVRVCVRARACVLCVPARCVRNAQDSAHAVHMPCAHAACGNAVARACAKRRSFERAFATKTHEPSAIATCHSRSERSARTDPPPSPSFVAACKRAVALENHSAAAAASAAPASSSVRYRSTDTARLAPASVAAPAQSSAPAPPAAGAAPRRPRTAREMPDADHATACSPQNLASVSGHSAWTPGTAMRAGATCCRGCTSGL